MGLFLYCLVSGLYANCEMRAKSIIIHIVVFVSMFFFMLHFSHWLDWVMHPSSLTLSEYMCAEEYHTGELSGVNGRGSEDESMHDVFGLFVAVLTACYVSRKIKKGK